MIKYIVFIVLLCTPGIYAMDDEDNVSSAQESDSERAAEGSTVFTDAQSTDDTSDVDDLNHPDSPGASDSEGW